MNYRLVIRQVAILVLLVGAAMSSSLVWALIDRGHSGSDHVFRGFLVPIFGCVVLGACGLLISRGQKGPMYRKEAIAVVSLGWIICGVLGAGPYIFSGVLAGRFAGAAAICCAGVFESVSGFTGAGASIFADVERLPRAILFWRSLTHWLGGMGIVVLFVAVLGHAGSAAKLLMSREVPGPIAESVRPRIKQTAMTLWKIYVVISAVLFICLLVQRVDVFSALCHTFGTMATGGFSTLNGSVGQFDRVGIEITIIVFMILAGTNFNLYALVVDGNWRLAVRNQEWRLFLVLLACSSGLIWVDLMFNAADSYSTGRALRQASFQAVSIATTTGFSSDNFGEWPAFSRWMLIMLMFIGGSAGSTSAGLKVIRVLLFFRLVVHEIERTFRPSVIRPLRIGSHAVSDDARRSVITFVGIVLVTFFAATALLLVLHNGLCEPQADQLDLVSALTAVAATMNDIGPGLNMVGPALNYGFIASPAKLLLALLMILGRLEYLVVFCLLVPAFWRRD